MPESTPAWSRGLGVQEALSRLGQHVGHEVVLIAASGRPSTAVNLDQEAARVFVDALSMLEPDTPISLVLIGERGFAGFADGVHRALSQYAHDYHALVPYRTSGVFTVLALGASTLTLHPMAGLGAHDVTPFGKTPVYWEASLLEHLRPGARLDEGEELRSLELQLAHQERHRLVCKTLLESIAPGAHEQLTASRLGEQLTCGLETLSGLGLPASLASSELRELLWKLLLEVEEELGLKRRPEPRYVESAVFADEVEFEMARGVPSALIGHTRSASLLELDTGRPDPDTGLLQGDWLELVESV